MKAKNAQNKVNKDSEKAKHNHVHSHNSLGQNRPHPLAQFFGCCLGDEPAPLSAKIQAIRQNLYPDLALAEVPIESGKNFSFTKDMIIGDILANFPQTQAYFQELHPLGLLSPVLNSISLEIFFSDLPVDIEQICQELTILVNQNPANV